MAKEIKLTQGQVTTVCDCHAHLVEGRKWCATYNSGTKSFYAVRRATALERLLGIPSTIYMHAVINGTPKGMQTDHENGNTLDNRCYKLRTATPTQNQMNQGKRSDNTSGFKGVSWNKQNRKWMAHICVNGRTKNIGKYDTAADAARAYDKVAKELHGEFAALNFPQTS